MTLTAKPYRRLLAFGRLRPAPFFTYITHEPHEGSGDCPVCRWMVSHGSAPCPSTGDVGNAA